MNLESPKVSVQKSAQELFDLLSNVQNFEKLMPENIAKFEVIELVDEKHRATIQCVLEDHEGKPAIIGTAKLLHQHKF